MRKLCVAAALLIAFAVSLVAQEVPGTSASTVKGVLMSDVMLDLKAYSSYFVNGNGTVSGKYGRVLTATDNEHYERIAGLSKDVARVDTPLEISLLSYAAGVVDIRPIDADKILPANNPRAAGLKLGSAVLKELAELKFLDPSNTAAIGRYEGMIKYISDKNGVSRADIEKYLKDGIAAVVDEEFNKVRFLLKNSPNGAYTVLLTRNTQNQYVLSYERLDTTYTPISGTSLGDLLAKVSENSDFNQASVDQVRAEAANIPAVFLAKTGKDPRAALADIITAFYLNPTNQTVYGAMRDVNVYYTVARHISKSPTEATLCRMTQTAYINAIAVLSLELANRVEADSQGRTSITLSSDVVSRLQFVSLRQ